MFFVFFKKNKKNANPEDVKERVQGQTTTACVTRQHRVQRTWCRHSRSHGLRGRKKGKVDWGYIITKSSKGQGGHTHNPRDGIGEGGGGKSSCLNDPQLGEGGLG